MEENVQDQNQPEDNDKKAPLQPTLASDAAPHVNKEVEVSQKEVNLTVKQIKLKSEVIIPPDTSTEERDNRFRRELAIDSNQVYAIIFLLLTYYGHDPNIFCLDYSLCHEIRFKQKKHKDAAPLWKRIIFDKFNRNIMMDELVKLGTGIKVKTIDNRKLEDVQVLLVPIYMEVERRQIFGETQTYTHFALAVFDFAESKVYFYDSCYRKPDELFFAIKRRLEMEFNCEFDLQSHESCCKRITKQQDVFNCGIHLCITLEQIILYGLPRKINLLQMDYYRKRFEFLLHNYEVIVYDIPLKATPEDFKRHVDAVTVDFIYDDDNVFTGKANCTFKSHKEIFHAMENHTSFLGNPIRFEKILFAKEEPP